MLPAARWKARRRSDGCRAICLWLHRNYGHLVCRLGIRPTIAGLKMNPSARNYYSAMICPYCETRVIPSRPSQAYRCGNCGKTFRAPPSDNFELQRAIAARAQEYLAEIEQCILDGLRVSEATLAEARERLNRCKLS